MVFYTRNLRELQEQFNTLSSIKLRAFGVTGASPRNIFDIRYKKEQRLKHETFKWHLHVFRFTAFFNMIEKYLNIMHYIWSK